MKIIIATVILFILIIGLTVSEMQRLHEMLDDREYEDVYGDEEE